jgi:hypothetical protein
MIKDLSFQDDKFIKRVIDFNKKTQEVTINIYKDEVFIKSEKIPFAHLPKCVKKSLNPR